MATHDPPPRPPPPDRLVLVVDAHPLNLKVMRRALQAEGFAAVCARDVDEARAKMRLSRPWLIMMDVQHPAVEALALAGGLKANPATRDILIIAFTSCATPADEDRILEAGFDGYLTPPVDLAHLHLVIRSLQASRPGQTWSLGATPPPPPWERS
jgi:CheY-like chemotaxis protein